MKFKHDMELCLTNSKTMEPRKAQLDRLIVPLLFFGLTMHLRKNLYTMIVFHLLFNLAGVQIYTVILGLGGTPG
jgi:hypothetical protein